MTHIALFAAFFMQSAGVWEKDIDSARAKAAEQKLPLLVLFATDPKVDEPTFDAHFAAPELKGWREKIVAVAIVWNREDPWAIELGIVGTPTLVIINPEEPDSKKQVMNVVGEEKAKEFPQILKNDYAKVHGSFFFRMVAKLTDAQRPAQKQHKVILLAMYDDAEASKAWHTALDEVMAMTDKTLVDAAQKTICVEIDAKTEVGAQEEKDALATYKATKLPTIFFIEPAKNEVVLKIESKINKAVLKQAILDAVKKANLDAQAGPNPQGPGNPNPGKWPPGMKPPGGGKFPKHP